MKSVHHQTYSDLNYHGTGKAKMYPLNSTVKKASFLKKKRKEKREKDEEDDIYISDDKEEIEDIPICISDPPSLPTMSNGYRKWKERLNTLELALPALTYNDIDGWIICSNELKEVILKSYSLKERGEDIICHNIFEVIQLFLMCGPMKGAKVGHFNRKRLKDKDVIIPFTLLQYIINEGENGRLVFTEKQMNMLRTWIVKCKDRMEGKSLITKDSDIDRMEGKAVITSVIEDSDTDDENELPIFLVNREI